MSQICGACGKQWGGEKCGHAENGWLHPVCYPVDEPAIFDLAAHLHRQRAFSLRTFGSGARAEGVIDHIRKELNEIEANPGDLMEWVDVMLLAFDGAWRAGFDPEEIAKAIAAKQTRNEARQWPDWRTVEPGKAIEHVRAADLPEDYEV